MKARLLLPARIQFLLAAFAVVLPACDDNPVKTEIVQVDHAPQWRVFSQSHTLSAVATFPDGGGVAVADDGYTIVRTGGQWAAAEPMAGDGVVINDVWGPVSNDVFAVGTAGSILHYDGSAWAGMTSGVDVDLDGVWGTSPDNVFAVGDGGTILRYDGTGWSAMTSNTQSALHGVHGTGPTQVFAVGDGGAFAEYDGASWSVHNQGTRDLNAVYAPDPTEVLAAGRNGRVVRRKDGAWAPMVTGASDAWESISGTASDDVYVCSAQGALVHYDGSTWSALQNGTGEESLLDLWPSGNGRMLVAGSFSRVREYGSDGWITQYEAPIPSRTLTSVCQLANGDAFVVANHLVWRIAGEEVTEYAFPSATLLSVWGSGPNDVFAVGFNGSIFHFDGSAWTRQQSNTTQAFLWVGGTSSDDVLAVGNETAWYDGTVWTPVSMPDHHWFYDVWGQGYRHYMLVGYQGLAYVYTGLQWIELDTGTDKDLLGVWGSSWDDVFVVGAAGTVLHYDGETWTPMESGTVEDLRSVWGRNASDVFVAGARPGIDGQVESLGLALHFDGDSWETIVSYPGIALFGVSGTDDETTWVGGSTVLRYGR